VGKVLQVTARLRKSPTEFEIIRALVEARLLIEAFESGEPPPEFEVAWSDDLEMLFDAIDPDNPPLTAIERAALEVRTSREWLERD